MVARATSTGLGIPAEDSLEALFRLRHLIGRNARGQFHRLLDAAIGKRPVLRIDAPPLRPVASGAIPHFVLDNPARAAKLAQRVEVAKRRHVRIGGVRALPIGRRMRVVCRLRRSHQRRQRPQEDELRARDLARRCRDRAAPDPSTTGPCAQRSCRSDRCPGGGKMLVFPRSNSASI